MNQKQKAEKLKTLHEGPGIFWIPNPWDAGSAKLFASMGFEALTTTSAGLAWVIGKPDGGVTRDESLANARMIVDAVDLPVAADLENGFGDRPEDAAQTIRHAAEVGLVGVSQARTMRGGRAAAARSEPRLGPDVTQVSATP